MDLGQEFARCLPSAGTLLGQAQRLQAGAEVASLDCDPRQAEMSFGVPWVLFEEEGKMSVGLVDILQPHQHLRQRQSRPIQLVAAQGHRSFQLRPSSLEVGPEQRLQRLKIGPARLARIQSFGLVETKSGLGLELMNQQDHSELAPGRCRVRRLLDA